MAVAAFLLHRRIGDGNHPVRAALLLLVVAGDAGDALFIVEAGDVLLELLVVDLGENGLGFFGSPLLGRDRVLAEGLDELVVALEVELDGSLRCEAAEAARVTMPSATAFAVDFIWNFISILPGFTTGYGFITAPTSCSSARNSA